MQYHVGIDPAYRKIGFGIIDKEAKRVSLQVVDLATWDGVKHDLKEEDFGPLLIDLIKSFDSVFKKTSHVFIEKQPLIENDRNRIIKMIQKYLKLIIQALYPHCLVTYTDMRCVRTFWQTRVTRKKEWTDDQFYREGKKESGRLTRNVLSEADMLRSRTVFKRNGEYMVDGIEAAQHCVYGMSTLKNLEAPKASPKVFEKVVMVAQVYGPPAVKPPPAKRQKVTHK